MDRIVHGMNRQVEFAGDIVARSSGDDANGYVRIPHRVHRRVDKAIAAHEHKGVDEPVRDAIVHDLFRLGGIADGKPVDVDGIHVEDFA